MADTTINLQTEITATGLLKSVASQTAGAPNTIAAATPSNGTTAGDYVPPTDSRLSDARTPTAHASTHAAGGADAITPAAIGALADTGGTVTGALSIAPSETPAGGIVVISEPADPGNPLIVWRALNGWWVGNLFVSDYLRIAADAAGIAPQFQTGATYAVGDLVLDGYFILYRCTTAHYASAWDGSKWEAANLADAIAAVRAAIPTVPTAVSAFANDAGYTTEGKRNLLAYASSTTLSPETAVYRTAATMSGTDAAIPTPDATAIPTTAAYFCFEMEVSVDATATSIAGPSGWTWLDGGELPTSGFAGATLYIAARLDCTTRAVFANVWRVEEAAQ